MSQLLRNAKHWRDRAEHTRTVAEGFSIGEAQKKKLLKVAEEYERLADRAAQWHTVSDEEQEK